MISLESIKKLKTYLSHNSSLSESTIDDDIVYFDDKLGEWLTFYNDLNDARKCVLIEMAFNHGIHGVIARKRLLHMISLGLYLVASQEIFNMKDTPTETELRLSKMMKYGEWYEN